MCWTEGKKRSPPDGKLLKPERASDIPNQIETLAQDFAREYSVSPRRVEWHAVTRGELRRQTGPVLWGDWRDEEKLALARVGFQVIYTRQFPWGRRVDLPDFARRMQADEAVEVGHVTRMAEGLLHFEGVLPRDELLGRVVKLVHPGTWYTPERGGQILTANSALRPPTSSGLISLKDTARPATLMKQKLKMGLPPRKYTRLELLDAADPEAPLSKDLTRIEQKLSYIVGQDVDVRRLQVIIKNQSSLQSVLDELAEQYEVAEKHADDWGKWLTRLWEQTPRYELGGRTPTETGSMTEAQD